MRLAAIAAAALIAATTLAGCGSEAEQRLKQTNSTGDLTERSVTLNNGKIVTCITIVGGSTGSVGITCDWNRGQR